MKTIPSSRRNHYLIRVSIFLIMVALITGMVGCGCGDGGDDGNGGDGGDGGDGGNGGDGGDGGDGGGGSGTAGDPYQIADWYELHNVRNYLDSYFILVNNLDSTSDGYTELASPTANGGKGWQPIGTSDDRFNGTFNGQGYEIRDLFIDRPYEDCVGLFCAVLEAGIIENIEMVDADVTGRDGVGILAGGTEGTVSNSFSSGSVSGSHYVGALAGSSWGTVSNSYSSGTVSGSRYVGGLLGNSYYGTVNGCYATGSVTGNIDVGGLVGYNDYGTVDTSYATGGVTASAHEVGGLVGRNNYGAVTNSYADGDVTGSSSCVGGLVGLNFHGTVDRCYSTGSVQGSGVNVGGLVGDNIGYVGNSYATGGVTGSTFVGGLVGYHWGVEGGEGIVSNCYATGSVTGTKYVGGLVGYKMDTVSNSFWDRVTSGMEESDGGTGKTTAEMKGIATFSGVGWDITAVDHPDDRNTVYIWNIVDGQTYPFLSWQPV